MVTLPRLRILLLALLFALLPVRGYAGLAMHLPAEAAATVAPCHDAAPEAASAQDGADGAAACALCDLCHGAMLLTAPLAGQAEHGAQAVPPALRPALPSAEPDSLFRPPRR